MGQPQAPSMITRLQACINAHEEKIQTLTNEMRDLTTTFLLMKEVLNKLPDSLEKMMTHVLKQAGKRHPGAIEEYIEEFEAPLVLTPDQSEEQSVGMFLRGLRNEVRNWVRALNTTSCDQALEFNRHVSTATSPSSERTNGCKSVINTVKYSPHSPSGRESPGADSYPRPNSQIKPTMTTRPSLSKNPGGFQPTPFRHFTKAEWAD